SSVDLGMIARFLPILAALALSGCEKAAKIALPAPAKAAPLPVVAETEIPSPSPLIVTVEAGMDLGTISAKAYGHAKFSGFVACLNGIPDPGKIATGSTLKIPSLAIAFREAGLDARYQP